MDDDSKRRFLQLAGNYQAPSGYQGPAYSYRLNSETGKLDRIPTTSEGVNPLRAFENSKPTPAQLVNVGMLNYGTPAVPLTPPAVPVAESGNGISFLALDPVPFQRVDGDRRDKRP